MAIAVFFAEGYEEIEALTVVDLARRAGIETWMVSVTGKREVTGAHNVTVKMEKLFSEVDFGQVDMIVLPGGIPGTPNLEACEPLMEQVKKFHQEGKYISAICAAPTILGRLGLLKDREACCYPGKEADLIGARVVHDRVAISDHIITSRGMGTAVDFGLEIVARFRSREEAMKLKQKIIAL